MRTNLLLLALIVALAACKKDNDSDPITPAPVGPSAISEYSQLAVGNYWVYDIVQYDTLGNETPTNYRDSVVVVGDTLVSGNTYYIVQGTRPLFSPGNAQGYRSLMRDSADCIVGVGGSVIFSLSNLGSVLYQAVIEPDGTLIWSTQPDQVQHTVPAGTFTCYDTQGVTYYPGLPERTMHKLRGEGVGLVEESCVFLAAGSGFRKKLVSYSVQ